MFGPNDDDATDGDSRRARGRRPWPDSPAGGAAFPVVVGAALSLVVAYSLSKTLQYPELFRSSARYRLALMLANAGLIAVGIALVVHAIAGEER